MKSTKMIEGLIEDLNKKVQVRKKRIKDQTDLIEKI